MQQAVAQHRNPGWPRDGEEGSILVKGVCLRCALPTALIPVSAWRAGGEVMHSVNIRHHQVTRSSLATSSRSLRAA